MSSAAKLAVYLVALVVVFAAALALGAAVGPLGTDADRHGTGVSTGEDAGPAHE